MFPGQYQYQYSGGESPAPSPGIRFRGLLQDHEAPRGTMCNGGGGGVFVHNNGSSISNYLTLSTPGVYDITLRQQSALMPPPPPQTPVYQQQQVQITRQAEWRLQSSRQASGSDSSSQNSGSSSSSSPVFYPRRSPSLDQTRRPSLGDFRGNFTPLPGAFQGTSPRVGSPQDFGNGYNGSPRPDTPRPVTPRRNLSPASAASFESTDSFGPLSPDLIAELRRTGILHGSPQTVAGSSRSSQERDYGTGLGNNQPGPSHLSQSPFPTFGNRSGGLGLGLGSESQQLGYESFSSELNRNGGSTPFRESSQSSSGESAHEHEMNYKCGPFVPRSNNGNFNQSSAASPMSQSLPPAPPSSPCYEEDYSVEMFGSIPSSQLATYTQQWR